ncbi:hypothetical protein CDAR_103631 [Caerostris darwini]|uniref:Homing endonuclease LAGLIDADG domain-containing protein n=1 Tax=Caerostris darwini TaxID=1538125 RepID=A0AAV4PJM2_9ARAC|nr:hypothetical protein CDAR_103631 [Caerostris darwini]
MERRAPKAAFKSILFPIAFQFIIEAPALSTGEILLSSKSGTDLIYRRFVGSNRRISGSFFHFRSSLPWEYGKLWILMDKLQDSSAKVDTIMLTFAVYFDFGYLLKYLQNSLNDFQTESKLLNINYKCEIRNTNDHPKNERNNIHQRKTSTENPQTKNILWDISSDRCPHKT